MNGSIDHPALVVFGATVVVLPLLLVTVGVLVVAVASMGLATPARRRHSRRLIRDLTEFARVLRLPRR